VGSQNTTKHLSAEDFPVSQGQYSNGCFGLHYGRGVSYMAVYRWWGKFKAKLKVGKRQSARQGPTDYSDLKLNWQIVTD